MCSSYTWSIFITSYHNIYHCTRWHLCECSVKCTDIVPDATTATPQAPARPCVPALQPASALPVQPTPPVPVVPTMPVTPKPQTTAVPATPAVLKVTPCTYTCDTQHSPCAAQKNRSCLCSTQGPDTRDVTVPQPMRGEPNLEQPWTSPLSFMHT